MRLYSSASVCLLGERDQSWYLNSDPSALEKGTLANNVTAGGGNWKKLTRLFESFH